MPKVIVMDVVTLKGAAPKCDPKGSLGPSCVYLQIAVAKWWSNFLLKQTCESKAAKYCRCWWVRPDQHSLFMPSSRLCVGTITYCSALQYVNINLSSSTIPKSVLWSSLKKIVWERCISLQKSPKRITQLHKSKLEFVTPSALCLFRLLLCDSSMSGFSQIGVGEAF